MRLIQTLFPVLILAVLVTAPSLSFGADDLAAGKAAIEAGRIDQAIDLLTKALKSGSLKKEEQAKAYFSRGKAHEAKGYWADAEQDYGWALALSGHNRDYLKAFRKIRRRNSPGPP
jgi:tetratricopeptide (TPR) repeat protein